MLTIRVFLLAILVMNPLRHYSQNLPSDYLSEKADIGAYGKAGSSNYDTKEQVYYLQSPILKDLEKEDVIEHFVYKKISGNSLITVNLSWEGEVPKFASMGLMIRSSLSRESPFIIRAGIRADNFPAFMGEKNGGIEFVGRRSFYRKKSSVLQLERADEFIICRASMHGEPLQVMDTFVIPELEEEVLIGLYIYALGDKPTRAKAWNVRIDQPVQKGYDAYEDGFMDSRLETINVLTGERKIIHEHRGKLEAPNWMPDGEKLLYNQDGHIYTISLEGGEPQQLDTGSADRNNNDHGISFDGKLLAISHHRENMPAGGSTVYVLPLEGGEPQLVTEHTPSYWHGWSPDNESVIYVAKREGDERYNIFRKSIHGGEEEQLTDIAEGEHVDGCEYDPAGEYIYYNGSHSGSMQIWRMKPDGSAREQLTFEETNNWFPHISPDGKWMVYLAYPADIPLNAHPFYQRISLKLMPLDGGAPRTIAYLYGGQGTINVPSWSPDSKHLAFVSNSRK